VENARSIVRLPPFENWRPFDFTKYERLPPLYFFLLVPFYILSRSEWTLRLVSVISGIISIPLIYLLGKRLFNKKIGLISALLLAISPFHLYYSQELRPYSLFLFFSLQFFYLSYLALESDRTPYYLGMVATFVLGFYTHTYMILPLFIMDLYFLLSWTTHRPCLRKWLLSHLGIGILCIPALYLLSYHIIRGNTTLAEFPSGLRSLLGTLYVFTMGRVFFPARENLIFIVIQGVIWGIGLLVGTWALWKERKNIHRGKTLSLFIAAGITYVALWIISIRFIPLFDESRVYYLIFLLPFYLILVAKGWDFISNSALKTALIGIALVISLVSIYPFYFDWDQVGKGNFRAAAAYVQPNLEDKDIIYHTTNTSTLPFRYYLDWRVPQVEISVTGKASYRTVNHFWLIVPKQQGGFEFGLKLIGQQNITSKLEENSASVCMEVISDPNFNLVDFKVFPGKNELTVCQFRKNGN
jgi:mannosyltransferase